MTTPLSFVVNADEITSSKLAELLSEFSLLFAEVDQETSGSGTKNLDLVVSSMSLNSPARFDLVARPKSHRRDNSRRAVRACITGIQQISESIRPEEFTDDALIHLQRLAVAMTRGIDGVTLFSATESLETRVTRGIATKIERIIPHGHSLGSVEGTLEALSIHDSPRFTVYDAVTGRAVRCSFPVSSLQKVKEAVGRKVLVSGQLRRDPYGNPEQITRVEEFQIIDNAPPVSTRDPAGLFSEIEDSVEYLARIRYDT